MAWPEGNFREDAPLSVQQDPDRGEGWAALIDESEDRSLGVRAHAPAMNAARLRALNEPGRPQVVPLGGQNLGFSGVKSISSSLVRAGVGSSTCGLFDIGIPLQWTGEPTRWLVPKAQLSKLQVFNKLYSGEQPVVDYPPICDPAKMVFCFDFRNIGIIRIRYEFERNSEVPFLLIYDPGSEEVIGNHVLTVPTLPYHANTVYAYVHATYSGTTPAWKNEVASGFMNAWKWSAGGNFANPKQPSWFGELRFGAISKPEIPQDEPAVRVVVTFFTSGLEIVSL